MGHGCRVAEKPLDGAVAGGVPGRRKRDRRAAAAAVVACLFVALAFFVLRGEPTPIDDSLLRWFRDPAAPDRLVGPGWLVVAVRDLSALGSASVLNVVVVLSLGALALEGRTRAMAWCTAVGWGGMLLDPALKTLFSRPRPSVVPHLVDVGAMSFPSGHALNSMVVYLAVAAALGAAAARRAVRAYLVCAALLLSLVAGGTRVYLGVHYPTDVLGGWSAGLAWVLLWVSVARAAERDAPR